MLLFFFIIIVVIIVIFSLLQSVGFEHGDEHKRERVERNARQKPKEAKVAFERGGGAHRPRDHENGQRFGRKRPVQLAKVDQSIENALF